jgi:hypothetical protein
MNKKEALDILLAVACCSLADVNCKDCPRLGVDATANDELQCSPWMDTEAEQAVKTLKGWDGGAGALKQIKELRDEIDSSLRLFDRNLMEAPGFAYNIADAQNRRLGYILKQLGEIARELEDADGVV